MRGTKQISIFIIIIIIILRSTIESDLGEKKVYIEYASQIGHQPTTPNNQAFEQRQPTHTDHSNKEKK